MVAELELAQDLEQVLVLVLDSQELPPLAKSR